MMPWWERIVPFRSYVKGWKISPSHYINQDLATVWLDKISTSGAGHTGGRVNRGMMPAQSWMAGNPSWRQNRWRRRIAATLRTGRETCDLHPTGLAAALASSAAEPAGADETPKRGGTLTYMIPADAPPSFDGHREQTFATVHAVAPFYSVLIRVNPDNPSSTTDFVCDLCTEMPKPTDDGKTYTFKIRDGRQVPRRLAADRRRCRGELERDHLPARRACSARAQNWYVDGR